MSTYIDKQDLIEIHRRLDVHKEVIGRTIACLQVELGHVTAQDLVEMLDESQSPFEG